MPPPAIGSAKIEKELADLKEQSAALRAQWEAEKEGVQHLRGLREQIEQTKLEIEQSRAPLRLTQGSRAQVRQSHRA